MGTAVGPRGPVAGISSRVAKCRLTAGVVVVGGAGRAGSGGRHGGGGAGMEARSLGRCHLEPLVDVGRFLLWFSVWSNMCYKWAK